MPGLARYWRSGIAPATCLFIFAVDITFIQLSRTPGLNLWVDAVTGLSSASLYGGSVAAGVSAFEGARWAAANHARLAASARPPLLDRLLHFGVVVSPVVGGYALALTTRALVAISTGTYGAPSAWWLTMLGSALVLSAGFGFAVGSALGNRLDNRWFVAPLVAIVFLAGYIGVAATDLPNGLSRLYPVVIELDSVFSKYVTSTMVGQSLLFLSGAVLVVVACGRVDRVRRLTLALIAGTLAIAAASGAGAVIASNGQMTSGYNPRDFACETRDRLTVCLNRGYSVALHAVTAQFTELNSRAAGTPLAAHRLEQNVEGYGDSPSRRARSVYLEQFADRGDIEFAAGRYVEKYGGLARCGSDASQSPARADEAQSSELYVDAWLSGDRSSLPFGDDPGESHLRAIESLSPQAANLWFRAHYADYAACDLSFAELP